MRENAGVPLRSLCEQVAATSGVSLAHLMDVDLLQWRKADVAFDAAVQEHKSTVNKLEHRRGRGIEQKDPDWREKWAEVYLTTGSKMAASLSIGRQWYTLHPMTQTGDVAYDEAFAKIVQDCTQKRLAKYEDDLEWAIDTAKDQGDARTVANTTLSVLERLDKKKWSRSEERTHGGTVIHEHRMSADQAKAIAQAAAMSRMLFATIAAKELPAGQQAIEAPQVVEAEVVR